DLVFKDSSGEIQFTMALPGMWDSSGEYGDADGAAINVDYDVEARPGGEYAVILHPDMDWLRDSERVYPVYLDPSTTRGATTIRGFKSDGYTANDAIRIGHTNQYYGCCSWRSAVNFHFSAATGKRVTGAGFAVTRRWGTTNAYGMIAYSKKSISYSGIHETLGSTTFGTSGSISDVRIRDWAGGQINRGGTNTWTIVRGNESFGKYTYKGIHLYLVINYVDRAVARGLAGGEDGVTPLDEEWVYADDVTMYGKATVGCGEPIFRYELEAMGDGADYVSPWLVAGPHDVPPTALTPGERYKYTIIAKDSCTGPVYTSERHTERYFFRVRPLPGEPTNFQVITEGQAEPLVGSIDNLSGEVEVSVDLTAPGDGEQWALFTIKEDGLVIMDSVRGSTVTGTGSSVATLPYELPDGGNYTVTARAYDGHFASQEVTADGTISGGAHSVRELPTDGDDEPGAVG
ncbi:MAG: hypothetical protein ACF8NJ_08715, partial [Phycisphaerales bacterium JB038]